jgi:uncharacterized protein (UPF0261 family)
VALPGTIVAWMEPKTIAVLGTLDTKGVEHSFVAGQIRNRGYETLLIDVGILEAAVAADVTREQVAEAGRIDLAALIAAQDRGKAVAAMARAASVFVANRVEEGRIHGIISLGGGGGTAIGTAAMRALPLGFPKLMVSTLASGDVSDYVGTTDLVMMPSIVDVSGINRISRVVLTRAAGAICGMVGAEPEPCSDDRPLIVASMFGNTTACVEHAKGILEEAGFEVLVFHSTGAGGRTMEALIESGSVAGVLDITTTELADELCGGVLSAGPDRLNATARARVPAVVVPGCLDMVNFDAPDTVPQRYSGRTFYEHNPQVTLMRTGATECAELGRMLGERVSAYSQHTRIMIPTKAISIISAEGQPFHDPEADEALFAAIREHCAEIQVVEEDVEINDPKFAEACAVALRTLILANRAIGSGEKQQR